MNAKGFSWEIALLVNHEWIVCWWQADLIHMGAKYSPCMRKDENIERALSEDRAEEKDTACCVNNDGSGCVQSTKAECSVSLQEEYRYKYTGEEGLVVALCQSTIWLLCMLL